MYFIRSVNKGKWRELIANPTDASALEGACDDLVPDDDGLVSVFAASGRDEIIENAVALCVATTDPVTGTKDFNYLAILPSDLAAIGAPAARHSPATTTPCPTVNARHFDLLLTDEHRRRLIGRMVDRIRSDSKLNVDRIAKKDLRSAARGFPWVPNGHWLLK